jgi:hypothetical protein
MTHRPDPSAGALLRRDQITVAPSPVGYLCIGFGEAARTLRFALEARPDKTGDDFFADPFALAATMVVEDVVPTPVVAATSVLRKGTDPILRRLAAIAEIAKFGGYNPDEPRNDHGEWTSEGDADAPTLGSGQGADDPTCLRTTASRAAQALLDAAPALRDAGGRASDVIGRTASDLAAQARSMTDDVVGTAERWGGEAADAIGDVAPKIAPKLPKWLPPAVGGIATGLALTLTPFNDSLVGQGQSTR